MPDKENPTETGPRHLSPYAAAKTDVANALRLGIEVESEDPSLETVVPTLTDPQIEWVAAWLAGEGFSRPRNPPV